MASATQRPVSQARLDADIPLTLCPETGRGLFSAPGIEGHRQGKHWAPVFTLSEQNVTANTVSFSAVDSIAQLRLNMELAIDTESDVLQSRMTIVNTGGSDYILNKLTNTLPLPTYATELMHFYGSWIREFHTERKDLIHGSFIQENRRGANIAREFSGGDGWSQMFQ